MVPGGLWCSADVTGVLTALIAVIGTLLGVVTTHVFQRRAAERDQLVAARQQLRTERLAAYSDFVAAVTEYRRGQQDRWHRRHENPDGAAAAEARFEAFRLRGVALQALSRVQLVAVGERIVEAARHAYECTTDVHKAPDKAELRQYVSKAGEALDAFIRAAASEVSAVPTLRLVERTASGRDALG